VNKKHIAVVGNAISSIKQAPWKDRSVKIWGLSTMFKYYPQYASRVDLWFEMHPLERAKGTRWWKWAVKNQPDVMMQSAVPELLHSATYPRAEIEWRFGRYFTSSPAFMLALAIDDGAEKISIFGVDMMESTEFFCQRPCFEYLVGYARGRGIDVFIPETSALLKAGYTYGYDWPDHWGHKTDIDHLMNDRAQLRATVIHFEEQFKRMGVEIPRPVFAKAGDGAAAQEV
jgi:hypothetical protein